MMKKEEREQTIKYLEGKIKALEAEDVEAAFFDKPMNLEKIEEYRNAIAYHKKKLDEGI